MRGTTLINIGGKDRPIYFGTNQSRVYCELRGITLNQMEDEINGIAKVKKDGDKTIVTSDSNGGDLVDLFYSALYAGARYHDIEVDFTNEKVGFWLDDVEDKDALFIKFYSHLLNLNDSGEPDKSGEAVEGEKK